MEQNQLSPAVRAAMEAARRPGGQFGVQHTNPAEVTVAVPKMLTIVNRVELSTDPAIPYPGSIPAGGQVSAGLEDSNGQVFVSIDWDEDTSPTGQPIHISCGGSREFDNMWSTVYDEETGLDDAVNDTILDYLREVQDHVADNHGRLQYASSTDAMLASFVAQATGAGEGEDLSDEAVMKRTIERGEKLATAFGKDDLDDETKAADAIADILEFARSKGIDLDELMYRARDYVDGD